MAALLSVMISILVFPLKSETQICNDQDPCQCDPNLPEQEICILECTELESCRGTELLCNEGNPCELKCEAESACLEATLISNGATDVSIICQSKGQGSNECQDGNFECGTGSCSLECQDETACIGLAISVQPETQFNCVSNFCVTTTNPTQYPTTNPTVPPIVTTYPTKTPTQDPTTAETTDTPPKTPTENPTIYPTLAPQQVDDEVDEPSSTNPEDQYKEDGVSYLNPNIYMMVGVSSMCCCSIVFLLCFRRRQRKKKQLIEAFSTTFGSKKDTPEPESDAEEPTHEHIPVASISSPENNIALVDHEITDKHVEYRKDTDNTIATNHSSYYSYITATSINTGSYANTEIEKGSFERQQKFEQVIKNTAKVEDILMDDIIDDMLTPEGPEPVMPEAADDDVFNKTDMNDMNDPLSLNGTGLLVNDAENNVDAFPTLHQEDITDGTNDDDDDVVHDMKTPSGLINVDDTGAGDHDDEKDEILVGTATRF